MAQIFTKSFQVSEFHENRRSFSHTAQLGAADLYVMSFSKNELCTNLYGERHTYFPYVRNKSVALS
jgi:hypothetical protein